ncbi:MAG TPA: hypothetical protein VF964_02280, partial [Vicinamibacteria bacterium]
MTRRGPTEDAPHAEATLDPARPLAPHALDRERLLALYQISRQLLEARDPGAVIRGILDALVRHLKPERGAILAVDADGAFRPLALHDLPLG